MQRVILLLFAVMFFLGISSYKVFAQDDDCCTDEDTYGREDEPLQDDWSKQMFELQQRKADLLNQLSKYNNDISALNSQSKDLDAKLIEAENLLYSSIGCDKNGISAFRNKFDETEKKINNKIGSCEDAKKSYFNEIEASNCKCLPEFYSRYLAMKTKLEAWCSGKEVSKSGQYTVVKGDCLWKIAGKKEIYNNVLYWPKLWEANQDGVISAPKGIPTKIVNPNLIYPGQVLRVPSLSSDDLKKLGDKSYIRKMNNTANSQRLVSKKTILRKSDIKKSDTKKDDVKKDVKKKEEVKKKEDPKKPEIKK